MPKNQETYKSYRIIRNAIINTAYEHRYCDLEKKGDEFLKLQWNKPNNMQFFHYIYVNNHGYYHPSKYNNLDFGLFRKVGKSAYFLDRQDNPEFHDLLTKTDDEIKFLQRFYDYLSNEYGKDDTYDWCLPLIPKIITEKMDLNPIHYTSFNMSFCLKDKDKVNYSKFYDLLQTNAAISVLLGGTQ